MFNASVRKMQANVLLGMRYAITEKIFQRKRQEAITKERERRKNRWRDEKRSGQLYREPITDTTE